MALLGVYINAGTACLGGGLTCFLHGIVAPFTPDYASYQLQSLGAIPASVPIALESLTASVVVWRNGNGGGVPGQMFVARFQELIR